MKKEDVFNQEINPDGISSDLENLTDAVWSKGYYCETDDGIWYEVYVNETVKEGFPKIDLSDPDIKEVFGGYHDIMLDHYESDGQITFFVPNGEQEYTLDELSDTLI